MRSEYIRCDVCGMTGAEHDVIVAAPPLGSTVKLHVCCSCMADRGFVPPRPCRKCDDAKLRKKKIQANFQKDAIPYIDVTLPVPDPVPNIICTDSFSSPVVVSEIPEEKSQGVVVTYCSCTGKRNVRYKQDGQLTPSCPDCGKEIKDTSRKCTCVYPAGLPVDMEPTIIYHCRRCLLPVPSVSESKTAYKERLTPSGVTLSIGHLHLRMESPDPHTACFITDTKAFTWDGKPLPPFRSLQIIVPNDGPVTVNVELTHP